MRWSGHVARGEERNAYRLLVRKPEGKPPHVTPIRWWADNIRRELGAVGGGVSWTGLAWLKVEIG
jgi:hypothetical protein